MQITIDAYPERTDEEVVELAQKGYNYAIESIFVRYYWLIAWQASQYYMNGLDNDDIRLEGMVGLYKAIKDYKKERGEFFRFAPICVKRQILDLIRKMGREKVFRHSVSFEVINKKHLECYTYKPDKLVIIKENIRTLLNNLSKTETKILLLQMQGKSYKDMTIAMNINKKAVDNTIQRIRKKMKIYL